MHYFSLFDTDGKAEVVVCIRELVYAVLQILLMYQRTCRWCVAVADIIIINVFVVIRIPRYDGT